MQGECVEVKSKSRQPWEFVKAEADRVGGLVGVVWVARIVGSCRIRRDGTLTFVYIWVVRSLLQPQQRSLNRAVIGRQHRCYSTPSSGAWVAPMASAACISMTPAGLYPGVFDS